MAGNGSTSGNGHGAESSKVPGPIPGGPGTSAAATEKKVPIDPRTGRPFTEKQIEVLERNKMKPGETRNPAGRKPGTIVAANAIHAILTAPAPKDKRLSRLTKLIDIAIRRADQKGDWEGVRMILNKWGPDQRIPDEVAQGGAAGVNFNLNQIEQVIAATEPQVGSDRPSFNGDN